MHWMNLRTSWGLVDIYIYTVCCIYPPYTHVYGLDMQVCIYQPVLVAALERREIERES